MKNFTDKIFNGDCLKVLPKLPKNCVDLIVTSPPYAQKRKKSYDGVAESQYVEWFLPIAKQLKRVLKDDGSFVLNIKEPAVDSERSTFVIELILEMKKQGWLWTEEYIWHKKIRSQENGLIDLGMLGRDVCTLLKIKNSR